MGHFRAGVSHTLLDVEDWIELLGLVMGNRFCRVDIQ